MGTKAKHVKAPTRKSRASPKPAEAERRYRVTLSKVVRLPQHSVIEVQLPVTANLDYDRNFVIAQAVKAALAEERAAGIERQWSSGNPAADNNYQIRWGLIEEIAPHITGAREKA